MSLGTIRTIILYLFLSACLAACQSAQTPVNAETILMPERGGDFRGIRMGDKPKSIKRSEQATSVYSMPDELIYRFEPRELDSTWYEISYSFNDAGLNNIHMDVYPANNELEIHLAQDFSNYYNQRYGPGKISGNMQQWRGMTDQGRFVTVALSTGKGKENRSCIRLVFNESNP
jgi:hypothetical protein